MESASEPGSSKFSFKIPPEPKPVPVVSSDEESFVVLGHSLVSDFEGLSFEDDGGKSIIQEAKQLLKEELEKISLQVKEQASASAKTNSVLENGVENDKEPSASRGDMEISQAAFETAHFEKSVVESTVLPTMPKDLEVNDDSPKAISIISFAPSDFHSEELQNKVSQLIDENIQLKDTIIQNNNSMKAQYERIVAWQKEVEKVHQNHKEKFLKAKEFIESLKKENAALQLEVNSLSCALNQEHADQAIKKQSEDNMSKVELDLAKKKITDLEREKDNLIVAHTEALKKETFKHGMLVEKLSKYEKELEKTYKTIQEMKAKETGLESKITQNSTETRDEIAFAYSQLKEANAKISELKENISLKELMVKEFNETYNQLENNLLKVTMDKKALSGSLSALTKVLEDTEADLQECKQKIKQLEAEKYQTQHQCEAEALRQQLMQSQKALIDSNQAKAQIQAEVEFQKNKIAEMQNQLVQSQGDNDIIYALRTQLEVYKNDFEAEKQVKEEIKREKLTMSEDLQNLHRRNQQMQEEIEHYREQLKEFPGRSDFPGRDTRSAASPTVYKCPKCAFGFRTIDAIENHLKRCLQVHGFP